MKILLSLFLTFPMLAFADVPAEQKPEVDHLIDFVTSSTCQFKRNFSYHTAKEAAEHIQKKYDYFKDDINTTEDFIRLSATKSLLTNKAYKVKCADNDLLESSTWLLTELAAFRKLSKPQTDAKVIVPAPKVEPAS